MARNRRHADIPAPILTREDWLHRAIVEIRPVLEKLGFKLPEKVYVSVGFGSGGGRYESKRVLGVCWHSSHSADGGSHIFISPTIGDTAKAVLTLVHELLHAIDDCQSGHRGEFRRMATEVGFEAPFTTLNPDIKLTAIALEIAAVLGEYPHAVLDPSRVPVPAPSPNGDDGGVITLPHKPSSGPAPEKNRWIVLRCPIEGHDAPWRTSRTQAALGAAYCGRKDEHGLPCLTEMV